MDKYKLAITPEVKILKTICKGCGKETIINDEEINGQIMVEDFVIKEQYCNGCGCNFYEVETSILLNMTHFK